MTFSKNSTTSDAGSALICMAYDFIVGFTTVCTKKFP